MKLNGTKNIITDKDITITEGTHLGDTLSEVLENHQEDISELKSNVKWLYKYGGVGSGSGGSGGSDKTWTIYASLGGKRIENDNTIALDPNTNIYKLTIRVAGGSESYSGTYQCGRVFGKVVLDASNSWTQEIQLNLTTNGVVSVELTDNVDIKGCSATYIVKPFEFGNLVFVKGYIDENGTAIIGDRYNPDISENETETIFIEDAVENGLLAISEYSISVEASASYKFTDSISNNVVEQEILDSYGNIVYEIIRKGDMSWTGESSGTYNIDLEIKINTTELTTINLFKSFSLIPNSLYLQVSTANSGEIFYDSPILDDSKEFYKYKTNQKIFFNLFTYNGSNNGESLTYECKYRKLNSGDWVLLDPITSVEREFKQVSFVFPEESWYELSFTVTCAGNMKTVTKFIYCYEFISDYKWFKTTPNGKLESSGAELRKTAYLRLNESNIPALTSSVVMNTTKDAKIYNLDLEDLNASDFIVNLGVQYNNINNTNNPIVELYTTSYNTGPAISIYQNKVVINGFYSASKEVPIFLKKEQNYEENAFGDENGIKSELITIGLFKVYSSGNREYMYQFCVYVNGILTGGVQEFTKATGIFNKVVFCPGNYCLNLFDITYANGEKWAFNDADINYYYDTYFEKTTSSFIDEDDKDLLFRLFDASTGSTYSIEDKLVKLKTGIIDSIAERSKVPTLVLQRSAYYESQNETIRVIDWLNGSYSDTNDLRRNYKLDVKLRWSNGKSSLKDITIDQEFGVNSRFYIEIQGSSTTTLKGKNLTLGLDTDPDLLESGRTVLFSPNYEKEESSSFLPEQEFTLKADIIDSSHSNNTSIGSYVNKNNTFDYNKAQSGVDENILSHTRQCLEGFPILLFLELTNENGENDTYYLGVYNFNLGRGSYFNLAYPKLNQLDTLKDANISGNEFTFIAVNDLQVSEGFIAAEVQDNLKYWDFSQWDNSILFEKPNDTTGYMFGDIVKSNTNTDAFSRIQEFVKRIARGGGYIFQEIGKKFEPLNINPNDNSTQYSHRGTVPDFKTQYQRTTVGAVNFKELTENDFDNEILKNEFISSTSEANVYDLERCIVTPEDDEYIPILNYESALYYYVTCMVFGLVDSVQKNLNIKTWDNNKFGLFFYDMDTSLGIDNGGEDTSYFAFSDYWETKIEDLGEVDENDNYPIVNNNGTIVYRDYKPATVFETGEAGYDIPSSYLLAIPKYVNCIMSKNGDVNTFESPQTLYAKWRKTGGPLENADKFIDNYFAKNLKDVPKCMLNLNYRCKYLYSTEGSGHTTDALKLKGTRVEKTRDWLTSRLRILDAYFNINGYSFPIFIEDDEYFNGTSNAVSTGYNESIPIGVSVSDNEDIYILRDIFTEFTGDQSKRAGRINQVINADNNSPLIILNGSSYNRYLLQDSNVKYRIVHDFSNTNSFFGGSKLWRTLDGIDTFADTLNSKAFYLNSDRLKEILGKAGTIKSIKLISPSVEKIALNSKDYSGELSIDSNFYNLRDIDISKSKLSLIVNNSSSVKNINLNNINSDEVTITDNYELQDIKLNNVSINKFVTSALPIDNFTIGSGQSIKEIVTTGNNKGTLTINSSATVGINFSKYSNVNITGSKISSIICNDASNAVLENINITNCPELKTLTLAIDNVKVINLEGCSSLETLTLKGTDISSFEKLLSLNLSKTKVSTIRYESYSGEVDYINSYLDLTKFPNLSKNTSTYFKINNNQNVTAIKFLNDIESPVILNYNFNSCTALERIYGHVSINCTYCFSGCSNFSLHGDITKLSWKNKSVFYNEEIPGRVMMPYEILNKNPEDITSLDLFQTGDGDVTNISMYMTNATGLFSNTSCSIFDIYYFFSNCINVETCYQTFAWLTNKNGYGWFSWIDGTNYNVPDSNLFLRAINVKTLSECFRISSGTEKVFLKLYSPEIDDSENVIEDNGLFSPLIKLENISAIFIGYVYYIDRFLFRRKQGSYPIINMSHFSPNIIVDSVAKLGNNHPKLEINNYENILTWGNLSNFFENISGKISEIGIFCNNTLVINYETLNSLIPETVVNVRRSFISSYGTGEIKPTTIFKNRSGVKKILNSFVVNNLWTEGTTYQASFSINNNTFSGFKSLEEIGYGDSGDYQNLEINKSSFCGLGINKVIDESSEFPYNIFANTGSTTIKTLNCIFKDAHPTKNYSNVTLPLNMFSGFNNLENISGLFYNIKQPFKLSDNKGFSSCEQLKDVSYLFAQDDLSLDPMLTGPIPKEFFYHGEKELTPLNIPQYWANDREEVEDEEGNITYNYLDIKDIGDNKNAMKRNVNSSISNMKYCFQHSNLSPYTNPSAEFEVNEDYYPGIYYSHDNVNWYKGTKSVNNYLYTEIWNYDGVNRSTDDCENLDIVNFDDPEKYSFGYIKPHEDALEIGASGYYFAPPDLLRYCSTSCNIEGLFADSGVIGWLSNYGDKQHIHQFGIKGRICPYMLKPVKDIFNVNYLFRGCKSLSYYMDVETSKAYMIPEGFFSYTKNINSLRETFSEMLFPENANINIFDELLQPLDIYKIFYRSYWAGTSENPVNLSGVFKNNEISNCAMAFCPEIYSVQLTQYEREQYIKFDNMFKDKFGKSIYDSNTNFSYVFSGYSSETVQHEDPKTLVDNTITHNYTDFKEV